MFLEERPFPYKLDVCTNRLYYKDRMILFDKPDPTKATTNLKSHGVSFSEGETVLYDNDAITITDYESDPNEERFVSIGMSAAARVLVVVYTYRSEKVRIISAREAEPSERKEYSNQ